MYDVIGKMMLMFYDGVCISIIYLFYREPVPYIHKLYKINNRKYRAIENFKPAFARDCHESIPRLK